MKPLPTLQKAIPILNMSTPWAAALFTGTALSLTLGSGAVRAEVLYSLETKCAKAPAKLVTLMASKTVALPEVCGEARFLHGAKLTAS